MDFKIMLLTCLVFGITLGIVFLFKNKVHTEESKIYSILLYSNILGIILEIGCMYLSEKYLNSMSYSIIMRLYFLYLLFFNTVLLYYVYSLYITEENKSKYKKIQIGTFIVLLIAALFVLLLPVEKHIGYATGPAVKFIYYYSSCLIFIVALVIVLNRKNMRVNKVFPFFILGIMMGLLAVVQREHPEYTISTAAQFLTVFIMFNTIENPDIRLIEQINIARDQADKANRAKTDFLSSMSHEIRTPLNAIVGMSEDISTYEGELPEQIREDASDIQVASQNLLEIVGNILDISKIESEKMEITELSYNFKEDAKALAKINAVRIGEKHIDFKVDIAEDIPEFLLGDKIHMKEVINNLVSNAIKYTESGFVNFTCKCINQGDICNLIISVQDSGRGIKQEDIDKLFNRFERLGVERNTTTEGTGLGLAITKKLVEMMGGKITVTSTYGQGSIFMVNIPQKIDHSVQKINNSDVIVIGESNEVDYSTKSVLVVDDNPLNIKVANRALANLNMQIDSVNSGQECIDKINAGNVYDVILMDIMMPGMSGETTLANLKNNPAFTTPVIALTADAVSGAREKYLAAGFNDYIAKPFNRDQIKEKLDLIFKK